MREKQARTTLFELEISFLRDGIAAGSDQSPLPAVMSASVSSGVARTGKGSTDFEARSGYRKPPRGGAHAAISAVTLHQAARFPASTLRIGTVERQHLASAYQVLNNFRRVVPPMSLGAYFRTALINCASERSRR
ncbi:hypothetical protein [Nocardia asiatica]|uniref:hypothetical protein n=1 Tax=Nocardia asiatica TaxID=209252 RepID=UPI0012FCF4B4|nr:hypothetical protein [Nocardia asiatica]